MKKLVLIVSILLICDFAYAQFNFGPKIGVNSTKLVLDHDLPGIEDGSRKVGFHAGVFGRFSFGPVFAQPELLYSSTSGEIDIDAFGVRQIQEYSFDQIDVPVLIGLNMGPMFRVFAGPVGRFLIGADGNEGNFSNPVLRNYRNATFGYQLGLGVDVGNLFLDLKYENNLSVFGDAVNVGNQRFAVDQRQNQIILSLGIMLL